MGPFGSICTLSELQTSISDQYEQIWEAVSYYIAKLVLVLPHSNSDAERVFSVVGLNKTKTRNSLALEETIINHDSEDGEP